MTSLSQRIAGNTLVQILGKAVAAALGVAMTILLTRYLGPAGYGTYTFVFVFVALFGSLGDWGLSLITIREASKNEKRASQVIGNVLVIRLILSFLAVLAANGAILFFFSDRNLLVLVAIASLFLIANSLKTSFQIIFNIRLKMQNWAISEVTANAVAILLVLFLIWQEKGLAEILWAFNAGHFAAAGVAAILGYRLLPLRYSLISAETKFLLWEALPMGAILAVFTVYNRVDIVILGFFKGEEAVGLYGAAYRILEVLVLGAAYFANSILPLISNYAQHDRERLKEMFRKSFVVLLLLGTGVALVNFILAPLAVGIIAGPAFAGSVVALRILSLVLIPAYFNHLNGYTLIALGKQWWSLGVAAVALAVNVLLNFIFIPLYSYQAAAFITFVTEGLIMVLGLGLIRQELGFFPRLADIPMVLKELVIKRGRIFER